MAANEIEQRVIDGTSWDEFCDKLKVAGQLIQRPETPNDAFNKAEGYRYLIRRARGALESALEYGDVAFPRLQPSPNEGAKTGADNPDNYYQSCAISPDNEYKISGTRGTVDFLAFSTKGGSYGKDGNLSPTGYVDSQELSCDENGYFELIISQKKHEGNWLPMEVNTNSMIVRQTFQDRETEIRAELEIECINATGTPEPFSAAKLDRGLRSAANQLIGTVNLFIDWAHSYRDQVNELPHMDQNIFQMAGGDPSIYYFHSQWRLADDEALVIEAKTIPECQTWNFQLDNFWMESLDFVNHRIHVNKHTAVYEEDGSVRIIVTHKDPGLPNWIDTASHNDGTMCFRWIGASVYPDVETKVVKVSELRP